MTTQIINNFNSLNSEDLSTVKGGACSFWGATAAVGVGACLLYTSPSPRD